MGTHLKKVSFSQLPFEEPEQGWHLGPRTQHAGLQIRWERCGRVENRLHEITILAQLA